MGGVVRSAERQLRHIRVELDVWLHLWRRLNQWRNALGGTHAVTSYVVEWNASRNYRSPLSSTRVWRSCPVCLPFFWIEHSFSSISLCWILLLKMWKCMTPAFINFGVYGFDRWVCNIVFLVCAIKLWKAIPHYPFIPPSRLVIGGDLQGIHLILWPVVGGDSSHGGLLTERPVHTQGEGTRTWKGFSIEAS